MFKIIKLPTIDLWTLFYLRHELEDICSKIDNLANQAFTGRIDLDQLETAQRQLKNCTNGFDATLIECRKAPDAE